MKGIIRRWILRMVVRPWLDSWIAWAKSTNAKEDMGWTKEHQQGLVDVLEALMENVDTDQVDNWL